MTSIPLDGFALGPRSAR